jgi:hypothetical protein
MAAPVMSQLELCLLTSLAVFHHHVLKNCDIKQDFVQSSLPDDETYFVKPPHGCPRSSPGTYWKLTRSLHGLHCAPRLWFKKLSHILKTWVLRILKLCPVFLLAIWFMVNHLYMCIYVDDIIFFSPSDTA